MEKVSKRSKRTGCKFCGYGTDGEPVKVYWWRDNESKFILADEHGNVHDCRGKRDSQPVTPEPATPDLEPWDAYYLPPAAPDSVPAVTPEPTPVEIPAKAEDGRMTALAGLLDALAPKVDADEVRQIIDTELAKRVLPTIVEYRRPDGEIRKVEGLSHKVLPKVMRSLNRGRHVLMVGPGGTGKSTIARQCAEAMGIPYYDVSLGPTTPESRFAGYMQATGQYVRTLFREAYEFGGVFHFDEFDNGNASILAMLNNGLANGHMSFPDGMVTRHKDFRCVASANTYGRGADRMYVGRQSLDVTTLDRFKVITVDIDESLETLVCQATGAAQPIVTGVLSYVRALRANVARHKMPFLVSPRASKGMCEDLRDGENIGESVTENIRKGASDADWSKIMQDVAYPVIVR